jgi:hypothetical protein
MLGVRGVVLDTHLADMELCVARLAGIEPAERQAEGG